MTLFGGFASTVCWPLSAFLVEQIGWRGACLTYAAIHIAIVLPLYLLGVPHEERQVPEAPKGDSTAAGRVKPEQRLPFLLLAGASPWRPW